jgi:hypothetical protein
LTYFGNCETQETEARLLSPKIAENFCFYSFVSIGHNPLSLLITLQEVEATQVEQASLVPPYLQICVAMILQALAYLK